MELKDRIKEELEGVYEISMKNEVVNVVNDRNNKKVESVITDEEKEEIINAEVNNTVGRAHTSIEFTEVFSKIINEHFGVVDNVVDKEQFRRDVISVCEIALREFEEGLEQRIKDDLNSKTIEEWNELVRIENEIDYKHTLIQESELGVEEKDKTMVVANETNWLEEVRRNVGGLNVDDNEEKEIATGWVTKDGVTKNENGEIVVVDGVELSHQQRTMLEAGATIEYLRKSFSAPFYKGLMEGR